MQATELEKTENYYRTQMQKDRIVERLKENGCRITKQRMVLMDVILSGNCSSCKEIYYKASNGESVGRNWRNQPCEFI